MSFWQIDFCPKFAQSVIDFFTTSLTANNSVMDSKDKCESTKRNDAWELSTALESACQVGNILEVKRLLVTEAPLSSCSNCNGIKALRIAIYNNDADISALLIVYHFPAKAFAGEIHLCQACEGGKCQDCFSSY